MIEDQKLWIIADIRIPEGVKPVKKNVTKIVREYAEDGVLSGEVKVDESGNLLSGIDLIEAAKQLKQEAIVATTIYEPEPQPTPEIIFIPLEQLRCHPINSSIYGNGEELEDLKQSIRECGKVKVPLTVVPANKSFFLESGGTDYVVVSGNRRFLAAQSLGLEGINAQAVYFESKTQELEELLASNISREKSIEVKVRELEFWEEVEAEKAKLRQGKFGDGVGSTRDIVAARIGWSGSTYEHAKHAVAEMDRTASADPNSPEGKLHAELKLRLTKPKGVDSAYKLVKPVKLDEELPKPQEFASVEKELDNKQQELGLGKGKLQVLPDKDRNEGIDPESPVIRAIQASNNLDVKTAKLVKEILDLEDVQQVALLKTLMSELVEGIFESARKQYFEEIAQEVA